MHPTVLKSARHCNKQVSAYAALPGDIYFPHPTPDLSGLPHGTEGDVVLDAVIDEHGKIAHLTLLKGLGAPIDQAVIATVQQWCYTPAKKEGIPVPSEQELHFHYQRG